MGRFYRGIYDDCDLMNYRIWDNALIYTDGCGTHWRIPLTGVRRTFD